VLSNLYAGRAAEHQRLVESYERAAAGQPQVVTLHGEAGIGRTRLATEFLGWASRQGAEVLRGGAFETGSHLPFQPVVEALRFRLEHENALKEMLGEDWLAPLSQLVPKLRLRYPDLPPVNLDSAAGRSQLFEPLVRLTLALAGQRPLVFFVDDLQWADSATLDLLQYAVRRWRETAAGILLLVSLRSEALQPPSQVGMPNLNEWLAHVEREVEPYHLELGPLNESDTVQMVSSILAPPAPEFAQWVFNETRGHPFYLVQTLKDLLERRVLRAQRRATGQWAFTVAAEHDLAQTVRVPSTVGAVIRARFDRLSPNAFTLLAAAAVLVQRLTFERLCAVAHLEEDAGLPALDELVSSRLLLELARPNAAGGYVFAHHMIRDVAYTEAGDARRRLFHQRALEALEAAKAPAAVLAHHALAAGLASAAFAHSLAAGQEALRLSAVNEAIVHFETARRLTQEAAQVGAEFETRLPDLYEQLGRAYALAGQPDQAQAVNEARTRRMPKQS
jgi:predicted ATPase